MAASHVQSHSMLPDTDPSYAEATSAEKTAAQEPAQLKDSMWRLRKHADYQRVYKTSRKQFSANMTYFHAPQLTTVEEDSSRVGLTAGRILGNAVERNRIKRRMREAIKQHLDLLPPRTDVILHPRRSVLEVAFKELACEVQRIFVKISSAKKS